MTTIKPILVLVALTSVTALGPPAMGQPSTYYVHPEGSDANAGGEADPFATIAQALTLVHPGDTVYVADGEYATAATLRIDVAGSADSMISIFAQNAQMAILDFDGVSGEGIDLRGSFVHLRGLIVQNAGDNGIFVKRASNNVVEYMTARYNRNSGVQVEDGSSDNLILNTDSYGNYDPQNHGENADGFAIKFDVGEGNVLRGCRAFDNSDDGFDFWEAGSGVTVEMSWAFHNGHNIWADSDFDGDSNGFKLGHGAGAHVLIRNLAWDHLSNGFDVNGNTTGVTLFNNTAFRNQARNFYFDEDNPAHVLRNNVSVGGEVVMYDAIDDSVNSWNGFNVGGADFESLSDDGRDAARGPDGSLPRLAFLRPAAGSKIIDAGMDVGIPFEGLAPDLGALEYGEHATRAEWDLPTLGQFAITAYPNPFRSEITVEFDLGAPSDLRLTLYDVLGRMVGRPVLLGSLSAGRHESKFYPSMHDLPAGSYYLVLEGGQRSQVLVLTHIQ